MQHYAVDQRKDGRVSSGCQRERQHRDRSETRRVQKLPDLSSAFI